MDRPSADWIVYVAWSTIVRWKRETRAAAARWGAQRPKQASPRGRLDDYPFQYASRQRRFLSMAAGDRLWLVTLPQFDGFCQAPSIMACLDLVGVYDRMEDCPVEVSRHSDGFGRYLAVGRPGSVEQSYPPLYNVYDLLVDARFEDGVTDLARYHDWLRETDFGARGPYHRLAQHFRTLRKLAPATGARLREKHRIAVDGRRVFLSYRAADLQDRRDAATAAPGDWPARLVDGLERARILAWWDGRQMRGRAGAWNRQPELIGALLDDGVRQATWFVALGTGGYGRAGRSGRKWTLEEWQAAGREAGSRRPRGELRRLLVEFGDEDVASRLPGEADVAVRVPAAAGAVEVAGVVAEVVGRR